MDKPLGWTFRETRGSDTSYVQVSFLPPRPIQAIISLTIKDPAHVGTKDDLNAVSADLLSKRKQFSTFKLGKRTKTLFLKQPAIMFDMTYKTIQSLSPTAPLVAVREKIVIAKVNGNFYFFRYQYAVETFQDLEKTFDHMIKSLRLK
jgi:hypothetical protein